MPNITTNHAITYTNSGVLFITSSLSIVSNRGHYYFWTKHFLILSYFYLELSARWNKKRSWSEYFQTMYKLVNFF